MRLPNDLHVSQHTVKNSLFRIFDKLGVSNRVELLFMTLSQERDSQSAMRYLTDEHGYMSLQDEATLIACQKAAKQGVLMAQVALAQFYSTRPANSSDALNAYLWYSIASEQIAQTSMEVAKALSMDQILLAEQMVGDRRAKNGAVSPETEKNAGSAHLGALETILRPQLRRASKSSLEPLVTEA